jgi:fatty acid desaturase
LFIKGWGWSVNLEHIVQQYSMAIIQNVCVGEWVGWVAKWGMRGMLYALCPLAFSIHTFAYIIFHDLCHNSFFKSKLLNEICGSILGPICSWQSFAGWHILHNEHHHHAGNLEQAQYPYSDNAFTDTLFSKVQHSFWHQTFLKLILPYGGGVYYPWKMYAPSLYKSARQGKSWFSSHQWHILYSGIISIGVIVLWNMFLCYIFSATTLYSIIATVLLWYVVPLLIFYTGLAETTFNHHFGENAMMMDIEKDNANVNIKWSLVRGVLMHTFNADMGNYWIDYIITYLGNRIRTDHVAHHLDYSIPCYNLSQATRIMKRCLQELANGEYRELTDDAIQALRNEQPLDMDSDGYISSKYRVSTEDSLYYSRRYEFILTDSQGEPVRDNRGRAIEYGSPVRTDVDGNKVEVIVTPFVNRKECNHPSHASDLKKTYAYCVHAVDGELELGNGVKAKYINKEDVIITQYNMRENPADINAWKMMWVNFEWSTDELRFLSFEEVITRKLEGASEWKKRWCFRMSRMLGMVG